MDVVYGEDFIDCLREGGFVAMERDGEWISVPNDLWPKLCLNQQIKTAKTPLKGIGDVAAAIFKPLARVLDMLTGTDFAHCQGCAARREEWNQKLPF